VTPAIRHRLQAALALLCALVLHAPAHADEVQLGGTQGVASYHEGVLLRPASFDVNAYTSLVAGTITVSVQRIEWGDQLSQLSTTIALPDRPDLHLTGNAVTMFDLAAGQTFSTSIYAQVAGPAGYGAYRLDVLFLPGAAQVPLPPAGWMLLSGMGLLLAATRRRPMLATS